MLRSAASSCALLCVRHLPSSLPAGDKGIWQQRQAAAAYKTAG